MNKIGIKLDIARFAKHVNFTYWVICHACESRHPELLILLDSRFRGNDDLYDKIAQFRYDIFILEVIEMTILKKLKDYLEKNRVSYEVGYHARVYTAQEVAASQHVPGKEMAKVVMVKADGKTIMLVLPASYQIDIKKLKGVLNCKKVGMVKEEEFQELFPDCEVGAMPPFGNPYNLEVWGDQILTQDDFIVFRAESHVETLRIKYNDYAGLVNPKVGDFSIHL